MECLNDMFTSPVRRASLEDVFGECVIRVCLEDDF